MGRERERERQRERERERERGVGGVTEKERIKVGRGNDYVDKQHSTIIIVQVAVCARYVLQVAFRVGFCVV